MLIYHRTFATSTGWGSWYRFAMASEIVNSETLWSNADPASEFPAQLVEVDWKDYRWVMVRARAIHSSASRSYDIILRCPIETSWTCFDGFSGNTADDSGLTLTACRRLFRAAPNGLQVSDCWTKAANSTSFATDNKKLIPAYAYGLSI